MLLLNDAKPRFTITQAEHVLQRTFGLTHFRPAQLPIVEAILTGRDVLAVLPTGGGKSLCFQVPALLYPGLTVVISPLIALMMDQVIKLQQRAVAAAAWHSQLSAASEKTLQTQLRNQALKLLYLSPEKLHNPLVKEYLQQQQISLIVIDEAHCISLWGHDFRPAYLQISSFICNCSNQPQVAAFTATATTQVKTKIITSLNLTQPSIITQTSQRSNLGITIWPRTDFIRKLITVLTLLSWYPKSTILIYCATREMVVKLARTLQTLTRAQHNNRRPVLWFHGGLDKVEKDHALKQFLSLEPVVMVATNAFGMGIDKSSIRVVIHFQLPSNLENYSQEIGRAGRDGLPAQTFLLYESKDWQLQLEMARNQPNHGYKMQQLKKFLLTKSCRARTLAAYFGDDILDCHCCDSCLRQTGLQLQPPPSLATSYYQLRRTGCPHISVLKLIVLTQPRTFHSLLKIPGIGTGWIARWGAAILSRMQIQDSLTNDNH